MKKSETFTLIFIRWRGKDQSMYYVFKQGFVFVSFYCNVYFSFNFKLLISILGRSKETMSLEVWYDICLMFLSWRRHLWLSLPWLKGFWYVKPCTVLSLLLKTVRFIVCRLI